MGNADLEERQRKYGGDKLPQGEYLGPTSVTNRGCTDILFLLAFIAFWVGMVVMAGVAFSEGNPSRILKGYDFEGNTCGEGVNSDRPYLYYPKPPSLKYAVCVAKCPATLEVVVCSKTVNQGPQSCPVTLTETLTNLEQVKTCLSNFTAVFGGADGPLGWCFPTYPTSPLPPNKDWGRCLPAVFGAVLDTNTSNFDIQSSVSASQHYNFSYTDMEDVFSDPSLAITMMIGNVVSNWEWIAVSGVVALVVSLGYILLLRLFAGVIAWATLFAAEAILIVSAVFLLWKANVLDPNKLPPAMAEYVNESVNDIPFTLKTTEDQQQVILALGVIAAILAVVGIVFLLVMCSRINFAIKVVKEAGKAVHHLPMLMLYPVISWVAIIILFVWWVVVFVFIFSAGTFNEDTYSFELDDRLKKAIAYHLFGLLWTRSFILAIGDMTMSGAIAEWYFAPALLQATVLKSCVRTLRYHLGTAAFGSFIIAIVEFIRICVRYYARQMKSLEKKSKIIYAMRCCTECCLACLDRFLKFASRQAYIQTAMHSYHFCRAAKHAFQLLLRNALRLTAVTVISHVFVAIGKLFIALCTAFLGALMIVASADGGIEDITNADPISVIIILLLGFAVANAFMAVFDVAIDTMFHCILEEGERTPNKSNGKGAGLKSQLDKNAEAHGASAAAPPAGAPGQTSQI